MVRRLFDAKNCDNDDGDDGNDSNDGNDSKTGDETNRPPGVGMQFMQNLVVCNCVWHNL